MLAFVALLLTLIFAPTAAWAWPPKFGPEFEFSNREQFSELALSLTRNAAKHGPSEALYYVHTDSANRNAYAKIHQCYMALEGERGFTVQRTFRTKRRTATETAIIVTYPDGFYFKIKTDIGVLEVTTKPLPLTEFEAVAPVLQRDLFTVMANEGFRPGKGLGIGSGHVNIDIEGAFAGDLGTFRDFMVDYVNHVELGAGIHKSALDQFNAKGIAEDPKKYDAFKDAIARIDRGEVDSIRAAVEWLHQEAFINRNIAAYVGRKADRLEIRAIRHQNSVQEFIDMARLFQERIAFLKKRGERVKLLPRKEIISSSNRLQRYRAYVEETGLPWRTYRSLLPWYLRCASYLIH